MERAVLFDLDSTLLDDSGHAEGLQRACRRIVDTFPSLNVADLLAAERRVRTAYWREVHFDWCLGRQKSAAMARESTRRTLHACGCDDPQVTDEATRIYLEERPGGYSLFADAAPVVEALREADIRLGLVTNGHTEVQRGKLEVLGIADWFQAIAVSSEIGGLKPGTVPFEYALHALDVPAERAWHVGDNLMADVAGARAAGLTAVWLNREGVAREARGPDPDYEIDTLVRLPELPGLA